MVVRPVLCRPFVGRREELAFLHERRREAASSHGALVLIAGEAGVGKSRLISEFCGSLAYSRWRIAQGPCREFARRPYGPILDVLARIDATDTGLKPAETKREQHDAIVDRFAAISARKALLVVIEDLHWADAATLELLAHLAASMHNMRMLLLASFRPDELHPEHPATGGVAKIARNTRGGRIDLAPLTGLELQTFITEALSGRDLADDLRRAIALAGEGNPFFTEELLKSAVEQNSRPLDGSPRRTLPQSVRAALLERLRPFGPQERRIVTHAAAIGRTFSLDLLATILGIETTRIVSTLRRAREFQLVEEVTPAVFRFRHGLTREAIYGDFFGAELQPLHRTIGLALEGARSDEQSIEGLAYHWWAAGDDLRSARYNELAGDAAGRVHAHEDAIAFYERAAEASAIEPCVRGSIVEKIAERRLALNSVKESYEMFGVAAEIFREARAYEREAACRVRAAVAGYLMAFPATTAPLEAMLARLGPQEYMARSSLHLGLSWLAASYWFPTAASRHLAEVDPRALAVAENRLRFHNVAAWIAMTVGDVDRFRLEHATRLEAAREVSTVGALHGAHVNGALCFSLLGLHEEALENVDRALRNARAQRNRTGEISANSIAAACYLLAGDLARARSAIEAVPVTSENRISIASAAACGTLVAAYLDDGAMIEKWFDGFEGLISPNPETSCGAGFAEIMIRRGRTDDAAAILHRSIPECELVRGNLLTLLAVGRYGAPRDRSRARRQLAHAAEAPADLVERYALTLFDAIRAEREEGPEKAAELGRAAADGFRRLRFPLLEAEAREIAGEVAAALALFRHCGATHDVRRLEAKATASTRPAGVDVPIQLSTREREIAALAARGKSNVAIARELAISHKTVEKHLASVYQKLGISSRVQLGSYQLTQSAS